MAVTRRAFLGSAAAASLLPAVGARAQTADLDVAIVGGGVAGAYTAWRLRNEQPALRVRLFEMSDRIGGRLRSVAFPQAPHLVGELGGMRFLESQPHVFNLVAHLNLPKRGYPVSDPQDRLDLRGKSLSYAQAGQPGALFPYNIPPAEQSPAAGTYMERIAQIVPDAKTMTPARWRQERATLRYKGRLLKDWAAWTLLSDVFTHEEMAFAQDASGYDDIALHQTALDEFDFQLDSPDESKPFFTVAGGYQRLPLALAEEAGRAGANVSLHTRLAGLEVSAIPGAPLTLALQTQGGSLQQVTARQVVLALPRHAIERIDHFPARNAAAVADLIASVEPVPACKALLLYPRPWWRDLGIAGGRSVTDMPARQFYALGAERERLASESGGGLGVLMMYSDANTVEYWKETVPPAPREACGFQWLGADAQLAQELHREAGLVYATTPPQPLAACFQDWTAEPFGGGWHFWGPGRDARALADRVMQPVAGRPLYICGEAYGFEAGWVEAALERAETMLQRHFGLGPPAWLAAAAGG